MLEIGSLVDGKYKILSEVGHGGMSVVYMAINEKANKTWAIKEVRREGVLDFEAVRQGLVVETDMLKKLHHPNLPSIIDVIEDSESMLIVMDYIEGRSLSKALSEYGAQPQELVIEWAKQLCDVLHYLHTRTPAIIYRDMKPSNVMLKPDGNVTLIDFGTAREYKEKNIADTTCLGTIGYAAPEQFGGMGQTDARTDIYCLGATLYHLVTGMNPSEPPYEMYPIRDINPSLSSGLESIILKCTQKNPDERYQDCAELMYALEHVEEIDDVYRNKLKRKMAGFIAAAACSLVFLIGGFTLNAVAVGMETDNYKEYITLGDNAFEHDGNEEQALEYYKLAISVPDKSGDTEAYEKIISMFEEDFDFSTEEETEIVKLMTNNAEELQKDMDGYVDLCYELGRLYFNYYGLSTGDVSSSSSTAGAKSSAKWFETVVEAVDNGEVDSYENIGKARVYYEIATFYKEIDKLVVSESDTSTTYSDHFYSLVDLMDEIANETSESVQAKLCALTRYSLSTYATSFRKSGITQEQAEELYDKLEETLNSLSAVSETVQDTIEKTRDLMETTKTAIELAYSNSNSN